MKHNIKTLFGITAPLVVATLILLTSFSITPVKSMLSGPKIVFDKLIHDYGTIPRRSDGTSHFRFTNRGNAPLLITGVKAACGCTVPSYTEAPVLPGQSGTIKVEYNTRIRGEFTKTIIVSTNDPNNATVTLTVKGNVLRR